MTSSFYLQVTDATSPKRASNDSGVSYPKTPHRHRTPNGLPRSRNSSRSGRDSSAHDSHGRDIGPLAARDSGDSHLNAQHRKGDNQAKFLTSHNVDFDNDNWIHRDKLARIESQELQLATMRVHRQVRTGSKSSSMRGRSHDSHSLNGTAATSPPPSSEQTEPWPNVQRQQLDSPLPLEDPENESPPPGERMDWDLRRPEEIAADSQDENGVSVIYKSPGLRKSSSRIPVLQASPHPISPDQVEREFPIMQRARTRTLGSGDEESISFPKARRASESAVIDTPEAPAFPVDSPTPPASSSRPGSGGNPLASGQTSPVKKAPAKGNSSSTRKASATNTPRKASATQKQRAPSGPSSSKERPATRSGENRPSTAVNRPEGDPPWLATMYKPDPRLPPDQQILPTHAKRLQQEQWEKEGKTPSTYDREFAPLAVRPDEPPRLDAEPDRGEPELQAEDITAANTTGHAPAWPLKSPKSPEPPRPGTSSTNYNMMPKLQSTPPLTLAVSQTAQVRMSPSQEPEKVEKGCGCCIVM